MSTKEDKIFKKYRENVVTYHGAGKQYRIMYKNGAVVVVGYTLRYDHQIVNTFAAPWPKCKGFHYLPLTIYNTESNIRNFPNFPHYRKATTTTRNYGFETPHEIMRYYHDQIIKIKRQIDQVRRVQYIHLLEEFKLNTHSCLTISTQRAIQVLHFHAHTIQLLFRRLVERKRLARAQVIHFLLEQQTQNTYLANEYVLRNIFTFAK